MKRYNRFGDVPQANYHGFIESKKAQLKELEKMLTHAEEMKAVAEFAFKKAIRDFEFERKVLKDDALSAFVYPDLGQVLAPLSQPFTSQWQSALNMDNKDVSNLKYELVGVPGQRIDIWWLMVLQQPMSISPYASDGAKIYIEKMYEVLRPLALKAYHAQQALIAVKDAPEPIKEKIKEFEKAFKEENKAYEVLVPKEEMITFEMLYDLVKEEIKMEKEGPQVRAGDVVLTDDEVLVQTAIKPDTKSKAPLLVAAGAAALMLLGNK